MYLGGCPGHTKTEPVQVQVFDDRLELRANSWGWRIGFDAVIRVGEPQPSPDGNGQMVPVLWSPAPGREPTLLLSGPDATRLRFLLAKGVADAQFIAAQPERDRPNPPFVRRGPSQWQLELRRMRRLTAAALGVAFVGLVAIAVAGLVLLGGGDDSHWRSDRTAIESRFSELQRAQERGDGVATAAAQTALESDCQTLAARHNPEGAHSGADFLEVQRLCAAAGITLF